MILYKAGYVEGLRESPVISPTLRNYYLRYNYKVVERNDCYSVISAYSMKEAKNQVIEIIGPSGWRFIADEEGWNKIPQYTSSLNSLREIPLRHIKIAERFSN